MTPPFTIDDIYRPHFHAPGTTEYAQAARSDDPAAVLDPSWAMIARSPFDVVSGIARARSSSLRVVAASGGQGFSGSDTMQGSVLIRARFDSPVRVDAVAQTARVPAGATWGEVVRAAAEHGLAAVHGAVASSDAVAFLLHGGISVYGRRFGVAANHVNSVTIVTADGEIRHVTAATEPRLFWALRGGGHGFGIVTEVEISLQPIARVVTASLRWDSTVAGAIAPVWLDWCRSAPREASSVLRLVRVPESADVPRSAADRQLLVIDISVLVEEPEDADAALELTDALTDRLRFAATPLLDATTEGCPDTLIGTASQVPAPFPAVSDSFLLSALDAHDLEHLLMAVGAGSGSTLTEVELRQLGAGFAEPERNGGAFDRTDADFSFSAVGVVGDDDSRIGHESFLASARARLSDRRTGFALPTLERGAVYPGRVFSDEALALIGEIRDEFDPAGLFARPE